LVELFCEVAKTIFTVNQIDIHNGFNFNLCMNFTEKVQVFKTWKRRGIQSSSLQLLYTTAPLLFIISLINTKYCNNDITIITRIYLKPRPS